MRILMVLGLLAAAGAAAAVAVVLTRAGAAAPSEQTARFLPPETDIYLSINLRPGNGQLRKVRGLIDTYRKQADFEDKLDELFDRIERETTIGLRKDVFPWLGPEVALAVLEVSDFRNPQVVAFVGTQDREKTAKVLDLFTAYQEKKDGRPLSQSEYRGFTLFSDSGDTLHFALATEYLVFATAPRLLRSTLDRMVEPASSLADEPAFIQARAEASRNRFAFYYTDLKSIFSQTRALASVAGAGDALRELEESVPDVLVSVASFVDQGLRLDTSYETPEKLSVTITPNTMGWAKLLPERTVALLTVSGLQEGWKQAKEQLEKQKGAGLDVLQALKSFEEETGLSVDEDLFNWMNGEITLALLPSPTDVARSAGPPTVHVVALIGVKERASAQAAMDKLVKLGENFGVPFEQATIGDARATFASLPNLAEALPLSSLRPGFAFVGDYLVLTSTEAALRGVLGAQRSGAGSLSAEAKFARLVGEVRGQTPLLFVNVPELVETVLSFLPKDAKSQYERDVAPYIGPLRAVFSSWQATKERTTFTVIVTVE